MGGRYSIDITGGGALPAGQNVHANNHLQFTLKFDKIGEGAKVTHWGADWDHTSADMFEKLGKAVAAMSAGA